MMVRSIGGSGNRTRPALVVAAVTALAVLPVASPAYAAGPPSGEVLHQSGSRGRYYFCLTG